jgi:murein DD-endopeptidase MepM/ murein hydrolase activator NlpD
MIPNISLTGLNPGDTADPKTIAAKVQGMFMEEMLKAMEESVDAEDGLFGGSASSDIYRSMLREQMAAAMSNQLNSPLENELTKALQKRSTAAKEPTGTTSEPIVKDPEPVSLLPVSGVITSPEGWRQDPFSNEMKYHAGTDIAAPTGTPIRAVADGRVVESGVKNGYGNTVVIQTDDGRKMLYGHNNQNFVQTGDRVVRGEEIAEVGSTGRATGPHVHFEVKF